jgi:exodeoxyribonuclease V gamma subunit
VIELDRLVSFAERPVWALLRERLGIKLSESFEEIEDAIPVELDGLQKWELGQRLLDGVLAGAALDDCMRAELAGGALPPGELARRPLAEIKSVVERLAAEAEEMEAVASVEVDLVLPDGRRLAGTVAGVCGGTIRTVSYSRVRARERIKAWVRLLALSAAHAERSYDSVVIGRARSERRYDAQVTVARIPPVPDALEQLATVIELYDHGMREPLPLPPETAAAYAQSGEEAAREAWTSEWGYDKEDRAPEHVRVFGGVIPFEQLIAQPGFDEYAHRLWDPLLEREQVTDR